LAFADDDNIVGENIKYHTENIKALLDASKEVGLEVNPEKTKHVLMPHCQKASQRYCIKVTRMSFEDVARLKYLGTTLTSKLYARRD
jgi:hypothetical protein